MTTLGEQEDRGEHHAHRQHAEQKSDPGHDAQFAKTAEIGGEGEQEDAGTGDGAEEVAHPGGSKRLGDRRPRARTSTGLGPSSHHVDPVVEAHTDQHQHEDDAEQVEASHQERRGAVGPGEGDQERDRGEEWSPHVAKRDHEQDRDHHERDRRASRHVRIAGGEFVRLQHRLAGEADLDAGMFRGDQLHDRADRSQRPLDRGERTEVLPREDLHETKSAARVHEEFVGAGTGERERLEAVGWRDAGDVRRGDRFEEQDAACRDPGPFLVSEGQGPESGDPFQPGGASADDAGRIGVTGEDRNRIPGADQAGEIVDRHRPRGETPLFPCVDPSVDGREIGNVAKSFDEGPDRLIGPVVGDRVRIRVRVRVWGPVVGVVITGIHDDVEILEIAEFLEPGVEGDHERSVFADQVVRVGVEFEVAGREDRARDREQQGDHDRAAWVTPDPIGERSGEPVGQILGTRVRRSLRHEGWSPESGGGRHALRRGWAMGEATAMPFDRRPVRGRQLEIAAPVSRSWDA